MSRTLGAPLVAADAHIQGDPAPRPCGKAKGPERAPECDAVASSFDGARQMRPPKISGASS